MGNAYLFTYDGLFVAQLFQDVRQGRTWSPAVRGMKLNDVSLHDEAFWSSISQSPDGAVVIIAGFGSHIVRIDGLETIRRLPPKTMDVTIDELLVSQASILEVERKRQSETKSGDLHVARFHGSVPFPAEWNQAIFVNVDKRGTAANFNSDSKPYDVTTALAVDDKNLYAAYRTGNKALLLNSGLRPEAPFLTGGALDLMLSTDPTAEGHCEKPAAGDIRLVVTRNKGRPFAVLYRAVVRNSNQPVYFTSPIQTVKIDVVEDVSDKVGIVQEGGDYLVAIPLNLIGLNPSSTPSLCGDIGILRGDGDHTIERVYWNNKATALTADVPSEAKFLPQLWGRIVFDQIK
jgi:hypothetical protein